VDKRSWKVSNAKSGQLGSIVLSIPDGSELEGPTKSTARIDVILNLGPLSIITYVVSRYLND
jgi:hypothetical protein